MRVHAQGTTAFERGRASFHAGERPALGLGEDALGWLSARHALFAVDELLPWTLPAKTEKERVIASGRELVERLRSELRHFQETRPGRLHDEQLTEALDLVNSWLAELTGQLRLPAPTAHHALTYLVREFGISETELGRDLIAFEDAAARFRRSQPAK